MLLNYGSWEMKRTSVLFSLKSSRFISYHDLWMMKQEQNCWAALSLRSSAAHCLEPTTPTVPAGDSDDSNGQFCQGTYSSTETLKENGSTSEKPACACLSRLWLISSSTRPWLSSWCSLSISWTCCRYWWWSCSRSDTRAWYPAEYCCRWATSCSLCARRPWDSWVFNSN